MVKFAYSPDNEKFYSYHGLVGRRVGEYIEFDIGRDCDHLTENGCAIYDERPQICRDHTCDDGGNMELSIRERITLLNTLPHKGSFTTLRILRQLLEDLSFSEAEHKVLKFKDDPVNGQVHWDAKGDKPKEFKFGELARKLIRDALEKASESDQAHVGHLELWDKFGFEEEQKS